MAFTERLALIIDAKTAGATSQLKALNTQVAVLERQTGVAGKSTAALGTNVTGLGAQLGQFKGVALAAGAAFVVSFGAKSLKAASDLNETLSKTRIVFGDAADAVIEFGRTANDIGLSDQAALDAVSSFGALFLGIGKTKKEAADLGIRLTQLAGDMASFNNTSLETAITAIGSGLRGEAEPLRQFNVLLNDATLKQEALKLGLISSTTQALTPAVKAQAAYSAILGQTGLQQGDFARTSDSLANKTKVLESKFNDLQAVIGEKLIPIATDFVDIATDVIDGLGKIADAATKAKDEVNGFIDALGGVGSFARSAFGGAGPAIEAVERKKKAEQDAAQATAEHAQQVAVVNAQIAQEVARLRAANSATLVFVGSMGLAGRGALHAAGNFVTFGNTVFGAMQRAVAGIRQVLDYQQRLANFQQATEPDTIFSALGEFVTNQRTFVQDIGSNIAEATGGGVADGLGSTEVIEAVDDLGDYLRAVAEDRLRSLDNVFAGLSSKLSFDDAAVSLQEATDKLAALRAEAGALKGSIAGQQSLVGTLLAESLTITPEEQVAIESAEKNLVDTLARFQGVVTQATAPSSSFLGPTTIDVFNAPTASLAELKVAENRLAEAKAAAVGPTRALEDAEKKLADLRERQADLPKLIADANRDLTRAQLSLVDAQRQLNDAGQTLIDQGPEFVAWFETIARQAGLSGAALANFAANLREAIRVGGGAKGLVDVFGNGTMFRTPSEANDILSWISGQSGGPRIDRFAGGGMVPGFPGQPQLVLAHGGEQISRVGASGGASAPITINVTAGMGADGQAIARYVHQELLALQRRSGKLGLN